MVLKFLKIILIGVLILVITLSILLMLLSMQPFVPNNYTQTVKTGGDTWKYPPKKNGAISMFIIPKN